MSLFCCQVTVGVCIDNVELLIPYDFPELKSIPLNPSSCF